jgi:hypothetical protein
MADASIGFGRKDCGLGLFGMPTNELALSSKQMCWRIDVLLDWSRADLPHPTAPSARDGTVDELEDLRSCVNRRIFSQSAISGTMVCAKAREQVPMTHC